MSPVWKSCCAVPDSTFAKSWRWCNQGAPDSNTKGEARWRGGHFALLPGLGTCGERLLGGLVVGHTAWLMFGRGLNLRGRSLKGTLAEIPFRAAPYCATSSVSR